MWFIGYVQVEVLFDCFGMGKEYYVWYVIFFGDGYYGFVMLILGDVM